MAPRRKQQAAELRQQGREVKIRVPESTMKFIERRARVDRRPINATIVKLLEVFPAWELISNLDEMSERYEEMLTRAEISFARYSQEITSQVLSRKLVETVDRILQMGVEAEAGPLRAALTELRAVRAEMRMQKSHEFRTDSTDRTKAERY